VKPTSRSPSPGPPILVSLEPGKGDGRAVTLDQADLSEMAREPGVRRWRTALVAAFIFDESPRWPSPEPTENSADSARGWPASWLVGPSRQIRLMCRLGWPRLPIPLG
jgi:hypothetical protein